VGANCIGLLLPATREGIRACPRGGVITGGGGEAVATMESAVTAVTGSLVGACETGTGFLG
jgi:hypothetical protein